MSLFNIPMPALWSVGFANFMSKEILELKLESRVDCAALYMSETIVNMILPTQITKAHGFHGNYT